MCLVLAHLPPLSPMDEARISSREFRAVKSPAFFASGSVARLHGAPKLAIEPTALLKVLSRDTNVKHKLDRSDEFDLEALGLTQAVSCFGLSEGAQSCGDERRRGGAFSRAQAFGRAQNAGHKHRRKAKTSTGHRPPFCLQKQLT